VKHGDGHSISEVVELLCNKTIEELSLLYKKSCKLTGLQFTTNGDESGRPKEFPVKYTTSFLWKFGKKNSFLYLFKPR